MEWNSATMRMSLEPPLREKESFPISASEEANIHGFGLYPKNKDSSLTFRYEERFDDWFKYVASRGVANATSP
jgi:hypothetical protein